MTIQILRKVLLQILQRHWRKWRLRWMLMRLRSWMEMSEATILALECETIITG